MHPLDEHTWSRTDPALHKFLSRRLNNRRFRKWADKVLLRLPGRPLSLRPRRLVTWYVVGVFALVGALVSVAVALQDGSSGPCGPGTSWTTVLVGWHAKIGDNVITATATTKSGKQESVTIRTPPHTGTYHIIGVVPDMGMPVDVDTLVKGNSVTLATRPFMYSGAYGTSKSIVSVDVCRSG